MQKKYTALTGYESKGRMRRKPHLLTHVPHYGKYITKTPGNKGQDVFKITQQDAEV